MPDDPLHDDIAAAAVSNAAQYLKGAQFPATKQDLIEVAERNGADASALEELHYLPDDRRYRNPVEVFEAIGDETDEL